jgi:SAM-dependent methyltransferase
MREIASCEVCGNHDLKKVLDLGTHPLCDDLIPIGSHRTCKEFPIEILFCETCLTAHQRFQVPKHELFQPGYHYRARVTPSVLKEMFGLVYSCEAKFGAMDDKLVLDIGCNDGSLLDFFKLRGAKTIGVEPTDAAQDSKHPTYQAFFDTSVALEILATHGTPDFITFTNVFAHIENLPELLAAVRALIGPKTVLIIENHYLGAVLAHHQFDTFYHEHPRTYSLRSFEYIANGLGLNVVDVEFPSRYGGNIRVYLGHGETFKGTPVDESQFGKQFAELAAHIDYWRSRTRTMIESHVARHGKLRAKAYPGRAAILIKLLGIDENHVSAVYEIKGSIKTGYYVPGTRIPILPEAELYTQDLTQPILNLAWHLKQEVRDNLASHGYTGQVIDII